MPTSKAQAALPAASGSFSEAGGALPGVGLTGVGFKAPRAIPHQAPLPQMSAPDPFPQHRGDKPHGRLHRGDAATCCWDTSLPGRKGAGTGSERVEFESPQTVCLHMHGARSKARSPSGSCSSKHLHCQCGQRSLKSMFSLRGSRQTVQINDPPN